jgi:membrane protease YdiL (CAAX protease family)
MSQATERTLDVLEALAVFAMIVLYIWYSHHSHPSAFLVILAAIVGSHMLRREGATSLGFRSRDLAQQLTRFAPALAFIALTLFAGGLLLQTIRPIGFLQATAGWFVYLPWGTFQQYMLNGYFLNRLQTSLPRRAACVAASLLFSGVHAPNWFLMLVTLVAGYAATRVYQRYQNLYLLGIAHATLGFLLFLVVPDSISHHLNVGPHAR